MGQKSLYWGLNGQLPAWANINWSWNKTPRPQEVKMNTIRGIGEIVYDAGDLAACKQFFLDWGLALQSEDASGLLFETLNSCRACVKRGDDITLSTAMEAGPAPHEVVWGTGS